MGFRLPASRFCVASRPAVRCAGRFVVIAAAWAVLEAGCGYGFSNGGKLPKGATGLRVAPVNNRTAQAEVGGIFEGALREELLARGQLSEAGEAPRLDLEVFALKAAPSSVNFTGAFTFRLDADVRAHLYDQGGAELLADQLIASEDYLAGVDVVGTEANRRAALRRLARNAAREVVTRLAAAGRFSP